jgi:hypothetical protein
MDNYYDKESRKRIEMINKVLNMTHRSKPYDFANIEDIKEAFMYSTGEFLDYQSYASELSELLEKYDESMEYYDPVTWLGSALDIDKHDIKVQKAYSSLRKAADDMSALSDRAEKRVVKLTQLLLSCSKEVRKAVFGKAYIFDAEAMEDIIEESLEITHTYSVEESRDSFLELMDAHFDVDD